MWPASRILGQYTERVFELLLLLKAIIMRIQGCLALSSLNLRATFNPFPLSETCLGPPGQASPHVQPRLKTSMWELAQAPLLGGKGSPLCRGRAQLEERSHLSRLCRRHRATQIHCDWGPEFWPVPLAIASSFLSIPQESPGQQG